MLAETNSMGMKATRISLVTLLFLCGSTAAFGQTQDAAEPVAIVEIGGAAAQSLSGDGPSGGPNVAVEVTPIERWLELEAGGTPFFGRRSTEWDVDLLFKKPWDLSDSVEFMAGVGPEWIHTRARGSTTNAAGVEAAADFMFWPSGKHRVGW